MCVNKSEKSTSFCLVVLLSHLHMYSIGNDHLMPCEYWKMGNGSTNLTLILIKNNDVFGQLKFG